MGISQSECAPFSYSGIYALFVTTSVLSRFALSSSSRVGHCHSCWRMDSAYSTFLRLEPASGVFASQDARNPRSCALLKQRHSVLTTALYAWAYLGEWGRGYRAGRQRSKSLMVGSRPAAVTDARCSSTPVGKADSTCDWPDAEEGSCLAVRAGAVVVEG